MIQRYTCVPRFEYEVLVLTNGSVSQVENKLQDISSPLGNAVPDHYKLIYLSTFDELIDYLKCYDTQFNGKIFFMFFNGLKFIQQLISDAMDYYQTSLVTKAHNNFQLMYSLEYTVVSHQSNQTLNNCYFYFDGTIFDMDEIDFDSSFNYLITIVSDVLKKFNFMLGNIKGIVIDDFHLKGDKSFPIHCLLRNYPQIERLELSSACTFSMSHIVA